MTRNACRNGALLTMQICSSMLANSWTAQWVLPSQDRCSCSGMQCQHMHRDGAPALSSSTGSSRLIIVKSEHPHGAQYGCWVNVALLPLDSKQDRSTQPRQHQGIGMNHSNFPEPSDLVCQSAHALASNKVRCTVLCRSYCAQVKSALLSQCHVPKPVNSNTCRNIHTMTKPLGCGRAE
jgi:hypothetical protein